MSSFLVHSPYTFVEGSLSLTQAWEVFPWFLIFYIKTAWVIIYGVIVNRHTQGMAIGLAKT